MGFPRLILVLSMSAVLAFGQAKQDRVQPDQKHEKADSGGKNEGIKVHGQWVLEIKNPDGSLDSRHEFENSLVTGGQGALASLLLGSFATGWYIELGLNAANGFPFGTFPDIQQPSLTCLPTQLYCNNTLTVQPGAGNQVVLQGSMAIPTALTLISVSTNLYTCPPAPPNIHNCPVWGFTSANTSLSVQQGQVITATVTISFS
jgi:hypothetical protein